MARRISRDELLYIIEELDRGEATGEELQRMVADLELAVSDAEAVDIILDDALTPQDIVDQLIEYPDLRSS